MVAAVADGPHYRAAGPAGPHRVVAAVADGPHYRAAGPAGPHRVVAVAADGRHYRVAGLASPHPAVAAAVADGRHCICRRRRGARHGRYNHRPHR